MLVYWLNLLLLGLTVGQSLYALGVLFCIVSTFLSIAFIFLVQINYAVAGSQEGAAVVVCEKLGGLVERRAEA